MDNVTKRLERKHQLWKVRSGGFFRRSYFIDSKRNELVFDSSKPLCASGGGSSLPLTDILEVRAGWRTDSFNRASKRSKGNSFMAEERCFSIIFGDGTNETLDLICHSVEERDDWVKGLNRLMKAPDSQFDGWLMDMFYETDEDKSGALNFEECCNLLTKLKIEIDKEDALELFKVANITDEEGGEKDALDAKEFVEFYHSLIEIPKIFEDLFLKYSSNKEYMQLKELLDFLHMEQKLGQVDESTAKRLIQQYEKSDFKKNSSITLDGFSRMMQCPIFNAYNDYHEKNIHQDMSQPLSHYYISSSHNTYLMGDQLTGNSSIEGYIRALRNGCKLVELDLHESHEGEIIITHGKTLTSNIYLKDVLEDAIKPYAFQKSPYPLILSIENHLSIPGQKKFVQMTKDVLQDFLLMDIEEEKLSSLPSPDELKHFIIVKGKRPSGDHMEEDSECSNEDEEEDTKVSRRSKVKKMKQVRHLASELKEIVNVCVGKKFTTFEEFSVDGKCTSFPSIKESIAKKLYEEQPKQFIKFTQKQIMKVYPNSTRINSTNVKPYPFWSVGAQSVTLNMQSVDDKANFYNRGLFKSNGNCGYVLKPQILLSEDIYDPTNPHLNVKEVIVKIRVISGQNLVKRPNVGKVNPYVQVKVRGHPLDKQKHRTKTVMKNGLNPLWNEEFELRIKVAPISFIYFKLQDDVKFAKDNVLSRVCMPFSSLTTGYRTVHLEDTKGSKIPFASLFVECTLID